MGRVSIKGLPTGERPRERLLRAGRAALSEVELVALVLGGDLACAEAIVTELGGATGLGRAVFGELVRVRGVGEARACQLVAAVELGRRAGALTSEMRAQLSAPETVAAHLSSLALLDQEELHVLALDVRNRLLTHFVAARGSLNVVHVQMREVFRRLVREGAAGAIVAHNHPSGECRPSPEDTDLTRRLKAAGALVGVPLLDHLVIARDGFYSFTEGHTHKRRRH